MSLLRLLGRSVLSLGFLALLGRSGILPGFVPGANLFNALVLGALGAPGFAMLLLLPMVLL